MIVRDPSGAVGRRFDLLVVGGGIYGACLLHQASLRGLSACLLEAEDFGGGTSWNSLRILHGGFRYLRNLDLSRYRQSVLAVNQWRAMFPGLIEPLECLLPLDGQGLFRPIPLRMAGVMHRVLGNDEGSAGVLSVGERPNLPETFKRAARKGLLAWRDYFMPSSERIQMELLRDACRHGAVALNRVRVDSLITSGRLVAGVVAMDGFHGTRLELSADRVVDCTGPLVGQFLGSKRPGLGGMAASLAINLLLELRLPGRSALAVRASRPGSQVLFLLPRGRVTLAGTLHLPCGGARTAEPSPADVSLLLSMLEEAMPGEGIASARILRVFSGLLPASRRADALLMTRPRILDHGRLSGLRGLWTVQGVKYTTANVVATRLLDGMFGKDSSNDVGKKLALSPATPTLLADDLEQRLGQPEILRHLQIAVREESVLDVDDLLLRRTGWALAGINLDVLRGLAQQAGAGSA